MNCSAIGLAISRAKEQFQSSQHRDHEFEASQQPQPRRATRLRRPNVLAPARLPHHAACLSPAECGRASASTCRPNKKSLRGRESGRENGCPHVDRSCASRKARPPRARARTGAQRSASARVPPAARGGRPVGVRHHDGGSLSVHEAVYAARRGHGRRPRRFRRGDVRQRARKMRKQPAAPRRPRRLRAGRGAARGASRAARRRGGRARALARALGRCSRGHSGAWGGFGARGGRGV